MSQFFQQGVPAIPGLPHRPPDNVIPPVINQVRDSMKARLPSIVGYTLINVLESGLPDKNPARRQFYNNMMSNGLNNPDYPSIVLFVADYAEALLGFQKAPTPDSAIEMAAKHVATIMSARIAVQSAQMMTSMNEEVRRATYGWAQMFETAKQMIVQYQKQFLDSTSPAPPVQQINQQGQMMPPMGFQGGFGSPQQVQMPQGSPTSHLGIPPIGGDMMGGNWQGGGSGNSSGPVMRGGFVPTAIPSPQETNVMITQVPANAALIEDAVFSFNCPIKPSFTPTAPYPILYDPRKNVVVYMVEHFEGTGLETGRVTKVQIAKKDADVKYEDHETEQFFRPFDTLSANKKPNDEKTANQLAMIIAMEEVEFLLAVEKEAQGDVAIDTSILKSAVNIKTMFSLLGETTPRAIYKEYLAEEKFATLLKGKNTPVMFSYRTVDPEPLSIDACLVLEGMGNAQNLRELIPRIEQLGKIYQDDKLSDNQWSMIITRLTDTINEVLNIRMGIKVSIDNAYEDIGDLLTHVEEKYGREIYTVLLSASQEIVRTSIVVDDLEQFGDQVEDIEEGFQAQGLAVQETVVILPLHSRDIVIATNGNRSYPKGKGSSALVMPDQKELFGAIRVIMENTHEQSRHVRMVTTDDREIFIYKGLLGENCFLVGWIESK